MDSVEKRYRIEDLNQTTWDDFEKFFLKYNGVQAGCWCAYYHRSRPTPGKTSEEKFKSNHDYKKRLVEEGKSRSILIYLGEEVIASCQYGTREELPRIEMTRRYKDLEQDYKLENIWRITCFFVDVAHRNKGLATMALKYALARIAQEGGGIVEAYPITKKDAVENWFGTVNMYTGEGFEIISNFGKSNVLVRKYVPPSPQSP